MSKRVCPWWLGYLLASPLRRLMGNPHELLSPYVREGMMVLEPGPGMGFFTLELARLVGPSGRVVAVEIQPRMIIGLKRRLAKAGLLERTDVRAASADSMGVADRSPRLISPWPSLWFMKCRAAGSFSPRLLPFRNRARTCCLRNRLGT